MDYTGHALVDVGIAALVAFARRDCPQDLTPDDLEAAAAWLARLYTQEGAAQRLVRGMAFFNAGYYQPTKSAAFVERVLYGWRKIGGGDPCAFCGQPSTYRADRESVPLLNGREVYNFGPAGEAGLPVCGHCSLALQMLPLGCVVAGGRLIAVHSDDTGLIQVLVGAALRDIRAILSLGVDKVPKVSYPRTRFVELLVKWLAKMERRSASSLTGYVFTNYGSRPEVRIYHLDALVVRWLETVQHDVPGPWQALVARHWSGEDDQRNTLYEDLLDLRPHYFLRRYLLPSRSWPLVETFLKGVMAMTPEEIETLRELGARFGEYARERRAFFYDFSREDNYARWRRHLLRAADDCVRRYNYTLISYDEFVAIFTAPSGEINDWKLPRDLITLLMIESRAGTEDPLFEEDEIETEEA